MDAARRRTLTGDDEGNDEDEGAMISTVEKVLFLKSIDLFSQIPGEELSQIALITDEVGFDTGDEIFREGEPGATLYFIIDGKVRIHSEGVGEDLAVLSERAVFGEMALLDSEPRSASATANTDVVLLKIERDDFNEILAEKPEIAQGIIKVLTRRLRNTLDRRRGGQSGAVPVAKAPPAAPPAASTTTTTREHAR